MVQDPQHTYMLAQAITKQKMFVEILYNGVPLGLPGCQGAEWACTLEAFLVRQPGLAMRLSVHFSPDACMFWRALTSPLTLPKLISGQCQNSVMCCYILSCLPCGLRRCADVGD